MATAEASQSGSFAIERFYDFLDHLRQNGYEIDTRQYIALHHLLLVMISQGRTFDEGLKTLVAPVICSTPEEQKDFYFRFDRWAETWLPKTVQPLAAGAALSSEAAKRGRWKLPQLSLRQIGQFFLVIIGSALIGLFFGAVLVWLDSIFPNAKILTWISFLPAAFGIILSLWAYIRDKNFIARGLADEEPVPQKVPIRRYMESVIPVAQFKPTLKALRKRVQAASMEVDVGRTIETALNRNKWLEFIYRQRQVLPEYVAFVDRKSPQDQQARFAQEVLQRLAADGVWLHAYEFSDDPRLCFPLGRKDSPLRLPDLQIRYHHARALLFCGTSDLMDPNDGNLPDWIDQLAYWKERAILTPDPIGAMLHERLKERGIPIVPLTLGRLASLVGVFEQQKYPTDTGSSLPVPAPLVERPTRWLGKVPPPEEEIDKLLTALKYEYLGEAGFYWLCALAVYPELLWEITIYLGKNLLDRGSHPLLDQERLLRLARLPWLRYSYLPDWMRLQLINRLDSGQNRDTRQALANLFDPDKGSGEFALEIARQTPKSHLERLKKLLVARSRKAKPGSPERDYIMIKFLTGHENQKLGLQLPDQLRPVFAPPLLRPFELIHIVRNLIFAMLQKITTGEPANAAWQAELFQSVAEMGPEGLEAVRYLRTHNARICFKKMRPSVSSSWTLSGDLTLNPRFFTNETPVDDLRLRTLIMNGTRYLQQGPSTALSVYGVLDAWQTEFRAYRRVQGSYPHPAIAYLMQLPLVYNRDVLARAATLMKDFAGNDFPIDQLPLFPIEKEIRYQLFRTIPKAEPIQVEGASGPQSISTGAAPNRLRAPYSNETAWRLASMSQFAYLRLEDEAQRQESPISRLKDLGFQLVQVFDSEISGARAILTTNGEYLVLAFRGDEVTRYRDVSAMLTATKPFSIASVESGIQSGFRRAYQSLALDIQESLLRRPDLPIYVTGHSLGAGLALVATQQLERIPDIGNRITACYTFGSPRVGNAEFDRQFNSPIYRIVNAADIVTALPLLSLGYIHVGEVHRLGAKDWEIGRGLPFMWRLFVFVTVLVRLVDPSVPDHAIDEYVRKLEIIAKQEAIPLP